MKKFFSYIDYLDFIGQIDKQNYSFKERTSDLIYYICQKFSPDTILWSYHEMLLKFWKNKDLKSHQITLSDLKKKKKEILFIIGGNRSLNDINDTVWDKISTHDSLCFNYSIFHKFIPTYYELEHGIDKNIHSYHKEMLQRRKLDYKKTIFLIHSRHWRRGWNPRISPEFFPQNPKYFYFIYPNFVNCPPNRPFTKRDFRRSIQYRGSLNLHLYFARLVGYKKIVLVGCEMDTAITFYHDLPEAQWIFENESYKGEWKMKEPPKKERYQMRYEGAELRKNQEGIPVKHSLIDTFKAINEFVFKPEGIELYVFDKRNLLYPDVPLFQF